MPNVFCSISLIVLTGMVVLMPGITMFAQEPEKSVGGKAPVFPRVELSRVVSIVPPAQQSPLVKFYVDTYEERKAGKNSCHYLAGWIYVKDQETSGQEVYIQLERPDGTIVNYSTIPMKRPDVGDSFNNLLYDAAGFSASIPLKDGLDIEACRIWFVVKNRVGIHKSSCWLSEIRHGSLAGTMSAFVAKTSSVGDQNWYIYFNYLRRKVFIQIFDFAEMKPANPYAEEQRKLPFILMPDDLIRVEILPSAPITNKEGAFFILYQLPQWRETLFFHSNVATDGNSAYLFNIITCRMDKATLIWRNGGGKAIIPPTRIKLTVWRQVFDRRWIGRRLNLHQKKELDITHD